MPYMGSHSVTCHPAAVSFPPLPQPKLVVDLVTQEGCKIELTYVCELSCDKIQKSFLYKFTKNAHLRKMRNCFILCFIILSVLIRGITRNLPKGGNKKGSERRKSPSGVQGQSPCGGLGAKSQKLETDMDVDCRNTMENTKLPILK